MSSQIVPFLPEHPFDFFLLLILLLLLVWYLLKNFKREKFLNSLLVNIGEGVYGIDTQGRCIWINQSALDMIGFLEKEVLYQDNHMLFHHHKVTGEDYHLCECPIHLTLKDKKRRRCKEYFIHKDGSFFPVALTIAPLTEGGGAIVVFTDISEQENQEKLIYNQKQKLEVTLSGLNIGIWEWDVVENRLFLDTNSYRLLEYDLEFVSNYESFLSIIHPEDQKITKKVIDFEFLFRDEFKIEVRLRKEDSSYIWVELKGKVIKKNHKLQPLFIVGSINDISHIKKYEEILEQEVKEKTKELKLLNEELETKIAHEVDKNRQKDILVQQQARLAAMGEMLGNIAHQWRQPLSTITVAMSGLLLKYDFGKLTEDDIPRVNEIVIDNAMFLSKTIDNFSNFYKKDSKKINFLLTHCLEDSLALIQASFDNLSIWISKEFDTHIAYYGSENLLAQVVLNILSNAKDAFVQNNHIKDKKVNIVLYKKENNIFIEIIDNGGGIEEGIKEKIFDPYFTTKHQSQGTGIGLYMSVQIIQNHFSGKILAKNVANGDGKGACFTLIFPLVEDEKLKKVCDE